MPKVDQQEDVGEAAVVSTSLQTTDSQLVEDILDALDILEDDDNDSDGMQKEKEKDLKEQSMDAHYVVSTKDAGLKKSPYDPALEKKSEKEMGMGIPIQSSSSNNNSEGLEKEEKESVGIPRLERCGYHISQPGALSIRGSSADLSSSQQQQPSAASGDVEEGVLIQAQLVEENGENDNKNAQEEAPPESNTEVYEAKAVSGARPMYILLGLVVTITIVLAVVFLVGGGSDGDNEGNSGSNLIPIPVQNETQAPDIATIPPTLPLEERIQVGNTIIGPAPFNRFGSPMVISANGDIVAVGARNNGDMGEDSGLVRVYELKPSPNNNTNLYWTQIGNALTGRHPGDEFAHSGLAMNANGTRIAIGATFYDVPFVDDSNGTLMAEFNITEPIMVNAGHVRVFDYDGRLWKQVGNEIPGLRPGDQYGRGVAMTPDGKVLAASAYKSAENGEASGHVRVFHETIVDGETIWEQMGSTLIGKEPLDHLGRGVSLSADGTRLVAGAIQLKGEGPGYVQVFEWDADSEDWIQVGQDVYGENDQDLFGRDVALSADGTMFAAGANAADNPAKSAGMAQVYQLRENSNGSLEWRQIGQTFLGDLQDDGLGLTVALSGDGQRFVVGASQKKGGVGYVRIFDYDNEMDEWVQLGADLQGENDMDKFGTEVVLSSDANTLAVGTIASDANGEDSGHVQVFNLKAL